MNKNLTKVSKEIRELPGKIFPNEDKLAELPTIDELKMLGMENLDKLRMFLEDNLTTLDSNLEFWKEYLNRALVALSLSEPRPTIPDFRSGGWVIPGGQVLVNLSEYETGHVKKRNFARSTVSAVKIPDIEKPEISICCRIDPIKWQVEHVDYDLYSPCIIKLEDMKYFHKNLSYLNLWLEFVGCCDPERKLDEETKCAMRKQIVNYPDSSLQ